MRTRVPAAIAGLLLLAACREEAPPEIPRGSLVRTEGGAARSLLGLVPEKSRAGEVFRRQPNGEAELVVVGTGLTRSDTVFWNGRALKTSFGSSRTLGVAVPAELLDSPGAIEIRVEDALDRSRATLRGSFRIDP